MTDFSKGCFTWVKIINMVVFAMAFITYIIAMPFLVQGLVAIGNPYEADRHQLDKARVLLIIIIVVVVISILFKAVLIILSGYYMYQLLKKTKQANMIGQVSFTTQGISVPQVAIAKLQVSAPPFPGNEYHGDSNSGHQYNGQQLSGTQSTEKGAIYPHV